jgi:heme A synthase
VPLRDLHVAWAWVVIIANGIAGVWALGAHRSEALRTRALWWFTVFAELAMFVQVALGVAAMNVEHLTPVQFHMFYGFVALFTVSILYAYRSQLRHRIYLLYGGGGLFLMGLGIRAVIVGNR